MEVGKKVFCKSDMLKLDNVPGTVINRRILGCAKSVTVHLETGEQVAFFGNKLACVSETPLDKDPTISLEKSMTNETPLDKDSTKSLKSTTPEAPVVKKRSSRRRSSVLTTP
tara:strand:- start:1911 stop:2246 length:336 start_codon:yes stop_codon:yes gene_type:complete